MISYARPSASLLAWASDRALGEYDPDDDGGRGALLVKDEDAIRPARNGDLCDMCAGVCERGPAVARVLFDDVVEHGRTSGMTPLCAVCAAHGLADEAASGIRAAAADYLK